MKIINKSVIFKICFLVGVSLIVIGILALFCWQWNINVSIKKSKTYVEAFYALTPESQGAVPGERQDNIAPVLSINETDFIGVLELPQFKSTLPVCADWGNITKYPCKFSGSIYDGTLQIGATSQRGQYDFYRDISLGDTVIFTDAEGNSYTYAVTNLQYEKHADQTTLSQKESALTLFIKNVYDFEYLIVYCDVLK